MLTERILHIHKQSPAQRIPKEVRNANNMADKGGLIVFAGGLLATAGKKELGAAVAAVGAAVTIFGTARSESRISHTQTPSST